MGDEQEPVLRRACRALLLTPDAEVLLIRIREPMTGWTAWLTPGGGMQEGEEPIDTLRRELHEETGLVEFELGPRIWHRDHTERWEGKLGRQIESFHLVRTPRFDPTIEHQPEAVELRAFQGFRWWTIPEIVASDDIFIPRRLGEYARDLVSDGPPAEPFDAGI